MCFITNTTHLFYYLSIVGVFHMMELPYMMGYPLLQLNPEIKKDSGIFDIIPWDEEDIEWAEYGITLWTNFAKYGYAFHFVDL